MRHNSTFKIVVTALFAALICVATMLFPIAIPATGGYANLGDGIILLSAFLMHPLCATAAAGLGSMLADILAGYMTFAPGTLVIKGGVALIAALIYNRFGRNRSGRAGFAMLLVAAIAGEAFMVLGYFCYEAIFLGYGMGAAAAIPGNLGQAVVGIIVASVLTPVLTRSHELNEMMDKTRR